jgi:hypothetical protein
MDFFFKWYNTSINEYFKVIVAENNGTDDMQQMFVTQLQEKHVTEHHKDPTCMAQVC